MNFLEKSSQKGAFRKTSAALLKKVRKNEAGLLEICAKRGFWQKVLK